MAFKEGDVVRQVAPVIEGEVTDIKYNKATAQLEYLVTYTDAAGETQARWFDESDLAVVGGAA